MKSLTRDARKVCESQTMVSTLYFCAPMFGAGQIFRPHANAMEAEVCEHNAIVFASHRGGTECYGLVIALKPLEVH